jgi:ribosomal protein S18 acetylase RimI-like enzyme
MPGDPKSLVNATMSLIRDVEFRRAIPDDSNAMALVHLSTWRTAYAKFIDESTIRAFSAEESEERFRGFLQDDRCRSFVAVSPIDGKVVGIATGGPVRRTPSTCDAELYRLHVLPGFQGRMIGTRLMLRVARSLKEAGSVRMLVRVFSDNPARTFYERKGGMFLAEEEIDIKGRNLRVSSYGFELSRLADREL